MRRKRIEERKQPGANILAATSTLSLHNMCVHCMYTVYTICTHQLHILTILLTMHINSTVSTPYSNSTSYPWEAFPPSHHLKIIYMVKVVNNEKTFIGKLGSKVPTALRYKPIAEASEAPVH